MYADKRDGIDEASTIADTERRKNFYRSLNKLNRSALCLSGGGIRSATFCLGVIQALAAQDVTATDSSDTAAVTKEAQNSLLGRFQFLSTVSGGGYIGSWLSSWRQREDFHEVWRALTGRPGGPDVEPPELSWLRAYSNYLTPRVGVGSADAWAALAIYWRNLLLNWLVLIVGQSYFILGDLVRSVCSAILVTLVFSSHVASGWIAGTPNAKSIAGVPDVPLENDGRSSRWRTRRSGAP
jgi:predicted acylesterase/phospholipase RssA